jgi:integrase
MTFLKNVTVRELFSTFLRLTGTGSSFDLRDISITDVKHSFTSAVSDAGIEDFTFHDLRHMFGTRLAAPGADVVKIRELMGHASITTTMRYMHASDSDKRDAIARMAARYAQKDCHKIVSIG